MSQNLTLDFSNFSCEALTDRLKEAEETPAKAPVLGAVFVVCLMESPQQSRFCRILMKEVWRDTSYYLSIY